MWYSWPTQRVRITSKRLAQPCMGSPSSMVVNFVMEDVEQIIQRIWPHLGLTCTWFSVHGQIILCDTLAHADKRPHAQSCNNEQAHVVYTGLPAGIYMHGTHPRCTLARNVGIGHCSWNTTERTKSTAYMSGNLHMSQSAYAAAWLTRFACDQVEWCRCMHVITCMKLMM